MESNFQTNISSRAITRANAFYRFNTRNNDLRKMQCASPDLRGRLDSLFVEQRLLDLFCFPADPSGQGRKHRHVMAPATALTEGKHVHETHNDKAFLRSNQKKYGLAPLVPRNLDITSKLLARRGHQVIMAGTCWQDPYRFP